MELLLRIKSGAEQKDVRAVVLAEHSMQDVVAALAAHVGIKATGLRSVLNERTGVNVAAVGSVADALLLSGDLLTVSDDRSPATQQRSAARRIVVTSGAQVGRSVDLPRGTTITVGRQPSDGFALVEEGTLGRSQFSVSVDNADDVFVEEKPDAKTKSLVNGSPLGPHKRALNVGDVLRIANLELRLEEVRATSNYQSDNVGLISFTPGPRRRPTISDKTVPLPLPVPVKPEPPGFQFVTVLVPAGAGVAMAAALGDIKYAAFGLLGPLGGLASQADHRVRFRRKFGRDRAAFDRRLKQYETELLDAQSLESGVRRDLSPDLGRIQQRAVQRTRDLWNRKNDHEDRLTVRLGTGIQVTSFIEDLPVGKEEGEFTAKIRATNAKYRTLGDTPITLDLAKKGCIAIVGEPRESALAIARSVVAQAVTFNSPETLVTAAIVPNGGEFYRSLWFLPHSRATTSPLSGHHVVGDRNSAALLLRRLDSVIASRAEQEASGTHVPSVLLVVDDQVDCDPALLGPILEKGPAVGVYSLIVTDRPARSPRYANAVIRTRGGATNSRVWFTEQGRSESSFEREGVTAEVFDELARVLAPLRDASAVSATSAIPRVVRLFDALGIGTLDSQFILENWARPRRDCVRSTFGQRREGLMTVDLVAHGPHALIGGTSGSGKSELVQALVAGLVVENPPENVQLLFIDFKGGSASSVFKDLPHVVGRITDLDEYLAERALQSIRAELRSRVELFARKEYDAADMRDMIERFPSVAPASLVIVIDEFATLVKELPGFVNAIIDIAQRGRSYGIHLILATQRPSTSVNENILANTNLRISLRMIDSSESAALVGVPDASMIPVPLRGRALARLGPSELVEFQAGFGGSQFSGDAGLPPVRVVNVDRSDQEDESPTESRADTELKRLCSLLSSLGRTPSQPVWQAPIQGGVALRKVFETLQEWSQTDTTVERFPFQDWLERPERFVPIGMFDDPKQRRQFPALVDLPATGGVAFIGSPGSGLTNALRTVADAASKVLGTAPAPFFALDFAGGSLASLGEMPTCANYAGISDLEAVTRIVGSLDALIGERLADPNSGRSRLFLLIDGYPAMEQAFRSSVRLDPGSDMVLGQIRRIIENGRSAGLFTCFTTDRLASLPTWLLNAVTERVLLRNVDDDVARTLGESSTKSFPTGAGLVRGVRIQLADATGDTPLPVTNSELDRVARLRSVVLEKLIERPITAPALDGIVNIGVGDIDQKAVRVDTRRESLTISGPSESGKSTILRIVASELALAGFEVYGIGPAECGLETCRHLLLGGYSVSDRKDVALALAASLKAAARGKPVYLVVDDVDRLDDNEMEAFQDLLRGARTARVIATATRLNGMPLYSALFKEVQFAKHHLVLQPSSPQAVADATGIGMSPVFRPGLTFPPGRGVLVEKSRMTVVQVDLPLAEIAALNLRSDRL